MAAASLALAACGGGDSVKTVAQPAPVLPPEPPVRPGPDCTMRPRPAGCPTPKPFEGLGEVAKGVAATALREVADTYKVQISGPTGTDHPRPGRLAIQGLQLRVSLKSHGSGHSSLDSIDTKIANVTSGKSGDNIAYSFGLYTPEARTSLDAFSDAAAQVVTNPFLEENKIFSLKDNGAFTSVERIESIASQFGEGWDYSVLKASVPSVKDGEKDSTLYAELWTDRGSASATDTDYMVGGWWLLVPNNPSGDYRFGVTAKADNYYPGSDNGPVKTAVTGEATYKGTAAGLHISSSGGMVSIQRLLGKVTLSADFGNATARGSIGGKIEKLTLDGESATGEILLPSATFGTGWPIRSIEATNASLNPKNNLGNIRGINYRGDWAGTFQGDSSGTDQPTGLVGVVGGSGGGNSFVASFGAKKVEEEQ